MPQYQDPKGDAAIRLVSGQNQPSLCRATLMGKLLFACPQYLLPSSRDECSRSASQDNTRATSDSGQAATASVRGGSRR